MYLIIKFLSFVFLPFAELQADIYRGDCVSDKLCPIQYAPKDGCCRFFLVRHGETDWNAQGLSQGWVDIPLNEEGIKQAETLARNFSDLSLAAVYSSALSRAVATSEIVASYHPEAKVIYDPALRFYDPNKKRGNEKISQEEAEKRIAFEVAEAALAYLSEVAKKFPNQNVVIITQGKVIKHLVVALGGRSSEAEVKIDNAAIVRIVANTEGLSLEP